ncbi:MAG: ester cyclase [Thermoleophilaceae bacterium]
MSTSDNVAALERMAECVNTGNLAALDEVVDPDAVDHDPAPDQGPGPEGFKDFFASLRSAFPDLELEPVTVVADGDQVALAYTISGTHGGEFMGIAPTGQRMSARGVEIVKFRDAKLIERWGSSDVLGIMTQLGATVAS